MAASAQTASAERKLAPPPLNHERLTYLRRHPTEFDALISRLHAQRAAAARVVARPKPLAAVGGTWTALGSSFPGANGAAAPHLMMDGTLLVHDYCTRNWYKLTPDVTGGYVNGKWSSIAAMPKNYAPLYFASQVLADGRLIMNGGEYNEGADCSTEVLTKRGAIYSPATNIWTVVAAPAGWTEIGDAQSVVLFNKDYMLADCCEATSSLGGREAILNPTTMTWTRTGSGKADDNDEEGWSLLPDGNLVTADAYTNLNSCGTNTELYNRKTGDWKSAGNSPVQLSDCVSDTTGGNGPSYEVGPQVLRSDGTVIMFSGLATGAPSGTAVYDSKTGLFATGANVPAVDGVNFTLSDAPAALEPGGKILFAASPGDPLFSPPTHFFEYGTDNSVAQITNEPPNAAENESYSYNFLVLPTGQILETDQSDNVYLYTPVDAPLTGLAPVVTSVPRTLMRGVFHTIAGTQLNGRSEAGAYGDDNQSATDYPLVRITNDATHHVFYCRTTNQSSRSIAPNAATTATFVVPERVETGASHLNVVTNGIASASKAVTIK